MPTATTPRVTPKVGKYLTDGLALYRVEALLFNREGVVLEDCKTMKLISLTFDQYRKASLTPVNG